MTVSRSGKDEKLTDPVPVSADKPVVLNLKHSVWTIVEGPQLHRRFRIEREEVAIGTAADNDIVLEDSTVSRRHALVRRVADGYVLKDLESRNGTFLDGNRIREAYLKKNARVRIGTTTMTFQPVESVQVLPVKSHRFGDLHGKSLAARQLFGILARVAEADIAVVLCGETGTGKEIAARSIHAASKRSAGPFVVLDCAAVDRELISAELFGHEIGAFTGASVSRPGVFEQAHTGTLLIDELGELPLDLQPKLLRVLERREVRRLGGRQAFPFDCRVIAATHRDLSTMVAAGQFREDLFHRLAQLVLQVPPLRERQEDIALLAERFLEESSGSRKLTFTPAALVRLVSSPLPGNVRELRNLVLRAAAMAQGPQIDEQDLFPALAADRVAPAKTDGGFSDLELAEKSTIEASLREFAYNLTRTAQQLRITRPTLRDRIRRYKIDVSASRSGRPRRRL